MKCKGQGKKDFVVILTEEDGTKRVFSEPVTINRATWLVLNSRLPLDFVPIHSLKTLEPKT